MLTTRRTNA